MIIILEGVDGSGKTTLLNSLQYDKGFETIIIQNKENLSEWLDNIIKYNNKIVITDRSFVSDLVYRLWDNKPRRGMDLHSMCVVLEQVKIIHCESGTEFDDSMTRGEDFLTNRYDSYIIKSYYNIIMNLLNKFLDVKICKYNWHTDTIDKVINFILE